MIKALPAELATLADFRSSLRELKQYAEQLHAHQTATIGERARAWVEQSGAGQAPTAKQVEALVAELKAWEQQANVMHLTLAGRPTRAQVVELASWFRVNVSPLILLAVHVNPEVLAGAIVRTPTHIYDLSFATKLKQVKPTISARLKHA